MPDKTEKSAAPKVIKWTEEEWASVANHLFEQKGAVLLSSPRLEEIRAKDVFMAQETLPEDRHRKLISIAQGFQGIRDRLSTIFQNMNKVRQDDLFKREQEVATTDADAAGAAVTAPAPAAEPAPAQPASPQPSRRSGRDKTPQPAQPAGAQQESQAQPQEAAAAMPPVEAPATAKPDDPAPSQPETPDSPAPAAVPAGTLAEPQPPAQPQAQQRDAGRAFPQQEQAPRRPEPNAAAGNRERQRERVQEPRPQGAWASTQASAGFIEAARPFVAMVCEEMALALVKVMGGKAGEQQLAGIMQKALSQLASGSGNGNAGYGSRLERQPRPERQPQPQPERQPQAFNAPADTPERAAPDLLDDESSHPAEVQPLFDPKLPPSANSDFKPTIGLVGANTRELDDLQLLYPQLRLTVVAPDAVRSADVFRQCQRIIGLREDVSQPVDELLRRLLRNRYIRIAGGIPRVREQLNAWLHNPGSINAEPRPHVPRGPKGQGQGEGGKKRHNRHLRAPR